MQRYKNKRGLKKKRFFIMIFILIIFIFLFFKGVDYIKEKVSSSSDVEDINFENSKQEDEEVIVDNGITIAIDPGHGGRDPGKIGINEAMEKDINLSIAMKLKEQLVRGGYRVVMTREEDISLSSEGDGHKQLADLKKRVDIVNNSNAKLAISIHQNSFTQEDCKGAQVFYYGGSQNSEPLAHIMQEQIKSNLQKDNKRKALAENSYYMLKNTYGTIIIIECGFLSNNEEANLLTQDNYQENMAEAIYLGIETYIHSPNGKLE